MCPGVRPVSWRVPADRLAASDKWGANCGPAAIAAACGLDLADVKRAVGKGKARRFSGHMGIPDIERACRELERPITRSSSKPGPINSWPREGVCVAMVQALGPWDGNPFEAAKRRHLVAARWYSGIDVELWRIYDVNDGRWLPSIVWSQLLMTPLRELWPDSRGWRISWRGTLAE